MFCLIPSPNNLFRTLRKYLLCCFALITFLQLNAQTTRYVRTGATGNGSSWANASGDLQLMINQSSNLGGDIILVGAGTYYPNRRIDNLDVISIDDRANAFVMKTRVKIYGGYSAMGGGTRDFVNNETILSGDLGVVGVKDDNAYHVLLAYAVDTVTLLDGFTIRDGNASNYASFTHAFGYDFMNYAGGGIFAYYAQMTLRNIVVKKNSTTTLGVGGGFYNRNSPLQIDRVIVESNSSGEGGGMLNTFSSDLKMINSKIYGNTAGSGSAAANYYSQPTFANLLVTGNLGIQGVKSARTLTFYSCSNTTLTNLTICSNFGLALYLNSSPIEIQNSIVYGNESGMEIGYGSPVVKYSLVQKYFDDGSFHNLGPFANPHFVAAKSYNEAPFTDGDFRLLGISPAINVGNNTLYVGGQIPDLSEILFDLDSNQRITGGQVDMGAFEYQPACSEPYIVWHVDENMATSGDGLSWATAFKTLGEALQHSSYCGLPDSILVAQGTYYPDRAADEQLKIAPNSRLNSFSLLPNVKLLGGYPNGGGTRNPRSHETILSGDIGIKGTVADNSYHVVIIAGDMGSALLDGFTIMNGNADSTLHNIFVNGEYIDNGIGGGITNRSSNIHLNDLLIKENLAWLGGGISNYSSVSILTRLDIRANQAQSNGGGMYNNYASPAVVSCNITGNSSYAGGGITNNGFSDALLINVTLVGNKDIVGSGAIENVDSSNIIIRNSVITQNSGGIVSDPGTPGYVGKSGFQANNSLIQGVAADAAKQNPDGSTDPKFISPIDFQIAPSIAGNFRLQETSPLINAGNNKWYNVGQVPDISSFVSDLDDNQRISGAAVDLGAYESNFINSEALCIGTTVVLGAGIEAAGHSFQWQLDAGSGFNPVADGIFYTGSQTNALSIKNIPGDWYGYKYRCSIDGGQQYSKVYIIKFRNTWTGQADNNWHNPANWSCGSVPDINTDVVVSSGSIVIGTNAACRSLNLSGNATVAVSPGVHFTILY